MPSIDTRIATALLALGLASPAMAAEQAPASGLPRLKTEVAFPKLTFDRPVALAYPADGSNLLFVAEQHKGIIQSFVDEPAAAEKVEFLKLPDPMNRGNEEGLLGLAFHPKYKENGQFFVYYSANDMVDGKHQRRSVVSRFNVSKRRPPPGRPGKSEARIWVSADRPVSRTTTAAASSSAPTATCTSPWATAGAADDPLTTGQNPKPTSSVPSCGSTSTTRPTASPTASRRTTPSLRDPKFARSGPPRCICIGLRNVWKFTFDRKADGTLWAGDVGQNLWEMVHVIDQRRQLRLEPRRGQPPLQAAGRSRRQPPVADHQAGRRVPPRHEPRAARQARGHRQEHHRRLRLPGEGHPVPVRGRLCVRRLRQTGRIWGVKAKDGQAVEGGELIDVGKSKPLNIAAFGEDQKGEVFILAFDGRIHKFVPAGE